VKNKKICFIMAEFVAESYDFLEIEITKKLNWLKAMIYCRKQTLIVIPYLKISATMTYRFNLLS